MNKIELNNKIRRFFSRIGGGGVKALQTKKEDFFNGNGGGGSSEEAQKLFDAMFGQTPYVGIGVSDDEYKVVPLVEYLTNPIDGEVSEGLLYKNASPMPNVDVNPATMVLLEVPGGALPDGPWYYTERIYDDYDLDLRGFPVPEEGSPVVLTGVDVPNKRFTALTVQGEIQDYHKSEVGMGYYCQPDPNGVYYITKYGNDWVWTYQGQAD